MFTQYYTTNRETGLNNLKNCSCARYAVFIPKRHTYIHDKNLSLFPTAVAEFRMSRLTVPQRKLLTARRAVAFSSKKKFYQKLYQI